MKSLLIDVPQIEAPLNYPVHLGLGAFGSISKLIDLKSYSSVLFVYDTNVKKHWADKTPDFASESVMPADGEKQKRIDILGSLWELFLHKGLDRHSLVVSVGGGALCDVAGFAASTYMRGIPFINVPTTLLSMVDSSIGGKNGINVGSVKNLAGTFSQPRAVIIDPELLKTLPATELSSGYAEVIKHALIADAEFVSEIGVTPVQQLTSNQLLSQIERNCVIKGKVVMADPYEKNIRKTLNFGHTVGHAFESLSHKYGSPLLHGEAVALGMIAECMIGEQIGVGSETITETARTLLALHGLPVKPNSYSIDEMMSKIRTDKKNRQGKLMFALPSRLGHCEFDKEVPEEVVRSVLTTLLP